MAYRDRIEFFNYRTKEYVSIKGPKHEVPPFWVSGRGANVMTGYNIDVKFGYRDLSFGKTNTYALYGGYSELDYRETGNMAKTVIVFSEDFEVLAKLNLDRSVFAIAVDEERKKIYAITTDEEPGIAIFPIPEKLLTNKKP